VTLTANTYFHRAVRLGFRVLRSISFRTRRLFDKDTPRRVKRNVLFPVRNFLLRSKPLSVRVGNQSFLLAPEGGVPLEMWAGRYFEKHELEFILRILRPKMTFVDVGANVGLFCIPAAKAVAPGTVFAFEPTSSTFQSLSKNIFLNSLTNVQATCSALGSHEGQAVLQVNVVGKDGLNTIGRPTHVECEVVATETVPITSLESFLQHKSIDHVDAMKIDTEGAELFVLRGAGKILEGPGAPLILYECGVLTRGFGYHAVETVWLLEKIGYHFFVLESKNGSIRTFTGTKDFDCMLIAVKPQHPSYPMVASLLS